MKKAFSVLLALLLLVALAACAGGSGTETSGMDSSGTPEASGEEAPSDQPQGEAGDAELRPEVTTDTTCTVVTEENCDALLWATDLDGCAAYIDWTNQWNIDNPDFQVCFNIVSSTDATDYYTKLSTRFASGDAPDMACVSATGTATYVEAGLCLPLNKWFEDNRDQWYEAALEAVTFDGEILLAPQAIECTGLFYNIDMFEEAGVAPPQTWDDILAAIPQLATDSVYGACMRTPEDDYTTFLLYPYLYTAGGDVLDEDGDRSCVFDSQASIDWLTFLRDVMQTEGMCQSSTDEWMLFGEGGAAMILSANMNIAGRLDKDYTDINYGILNYPAQKEGGAGVSVSGGWRFFINAESPVAEQCGEYFDYLFDGDAQIWVDFCSVQTDSASRYDVAEALAASEFAAAHPKFIEADALVAPTCYMERAYNAKTADAINKAIQAAMFGTEDIAAIVSSTAATIEGSLS